MPPPSFASFFLKSFRYRASEVQCPFASWISPLCFADQTWRHSHWRVLYFRLPLWVVEPSVPQPISWKWVEAKATVAIPGRTSVSQNHPSHSNLTQWILLARAVQSPLLPFAETTGDEMCMSTTTLPANAQIVPSTMLAVAFVMSQRHSPPAVSEPPLPLHTLTAKDFSSYTRRFCSSPALGVLRRILRDELEVTSYHALFLCARVRLSAVGFRIRSVHPSTHEGRFRCGGSEQRSLASVGCGRRMHSSRRPSKCHL